MTDQEFKELRRMVERRVCEARALQFAAQKRRVPRFVKDQLQEVTFGLRQRQTSST